MSEALRVVSVFEGFFSGGARIVHSDTIRALHAQGQRHSVVAINNEVTREQTRQPMENDRCYKELRAAGLGIASLGRHSGAAPDYKPFGKRELRTFADSISGANLLLSLKEQPLRLINQAAEYGTPLPPVVVGLHRSDPEHQGRAVDSLRNALKLGRVVACVAAGQACKDAYVATGIPGHTITPVMNGIDLKKFTPSPMQRHDIRHRLEIPPTAPTVVFAARYDVDMKDPELFLKSARIFLERDPRAHVVMSGAGMNGSNDGLMGIVRCAFKGGDHLERRLRLLGIRNDMPAVYAAADVVSSTSKYGEAYPLCLMEGAACGAIPVATDVGDSKDIVGNGRGILTSRDPEAIAHAWQTAWLHRDRYLDTILRTKRRFARERMVSAWSTIISRHAKR